MIRSAIFVAAFLSTLLPSVARAQLPDRNGDPVELAGRWMGKTILLDTLARWKDIPATRAQTFSAVLKVLQHHLKLPVETADSARGVVFNTRVVVRGKLAGKPASKWLRCGTGMLGD